MKTTVFIISNHLMFSRGLESLLSQNKNLTVVGQETDIDPAIDRINELSPDVVMLDSTKAHENSAQKIVRILRTVPGVRVIGLSLQDNNFTLYRARQWVAETVDDLIAAVEISSR